MNSRSEAAIEQVRDRISEARVALDYLRDGLLDVETPPPPSLNLSRDLRGLAASFAEIAELALDKMEDPSALYHIARDATARFSRIVAEIADEETRVTRDEATLMKGGNLSPKTPSPLRRSARLIAIKRIAAGAESLPLEVLPGSKPNRSLQARAFAVLEITDGTLENYRRTRSGEFLRHELKCIAAVAEWARNHRPHPGELFRDIVPKINGVRFNRPNCEEIRRICHKHDALWPFSTKSCGRYARTVLVPWILERYPDLQQTPFSDLGNSKAGDGPKLGTLKARIATALLPFAV